MFARNALNSKSAMYWSISLSFILSSVSLFWAHSCSTVVDEGLEELLFQSLPDVHIMGEDAGVVLDFFEPRVHTHGPAFDLWTL